MEQNVIDELRSLEMIVLNWKNNYLGMRAPEGGDEFLADDFHEEITTHVSPFVRRLYENSHLTLSQAHDFLNACYKHVEDLRQSLVERSDDEKTLNDIAPCI